MSAIVGKTTEFMARALGHALAVVALLAMAGMLEFMSAPSWLKNQPIWFACMVILGALGLPEVIGSWIGRGVKAYRAALDAGDDE
jgi:uncharacterized membrane protein YfcA